MNESEKDPGARRVKLALLIVSLATLFLLGVSAWRENFFPEWRQHRLEYANILEQAATDERSLAIARQFEIGIDQIVIPALGATERCITCHTGLEDPRMGGERQPFRTHPASLLTDHPVEQFGCTVCHQGQGRATESEDAHGRVANWTRPMFTKDFAYSACTQCHESEALSDRMAAQAMAEREPRGPGAELMERGRHLFDSAGCLGCHVRNGTGGKLGPDVSFVGDKERHDFDFSHFGKNEPREVTHWLKRHFLEPAEISPGTVMPDLKLSDEDASALTAYVLTFRRRDVPKAYLAAPAAGRPAKAELTGEQIYMQMCSACHGVDGRESDVPGIRTPALNNPDFLAVATDDYLRHIVENGRSGTAMPAWGGNAKSLTRGEIDRVVAHVRGWEHEPPDLGRISSRAGDRAMGQAYYLGMCANCHGLEGEGGLGNALNSPSFLGIASDRFLAETIVGGRPGTAMASWKHLPAQAVSDLLAYVRSWESPAPTLAEVSSVLEAGPSPELIETGRVLFRGNCATCHGSAGEGGIGPRLVSSGIGPAVEDRFLFTSITGGRPTTAMPAWRHLSADQIAALIAFIRAETDAPQLELSDPPGGGDYDLGAVQYKTSCSQCHGENGEGGIGPQLANPAFLRAVSDRTLFYWISHGRTGTAMKGFAPEEQGPTTLTPAHIADVIAHLRRLGNRTDPDIKRTGEGDAVLGGQLYATNCASCHGADGEGASGPQLHNETFLRSASDGFLAATIALGRTGTAMQSMIHGQEGLGQIQPERVRDVVAYLRTWDVEEPWTKPRAIAEMSRRAIDSGERKYAKYCSGCHGTNGRGVADGADFFAPSLNNPEFLDASSDGFLQATIARGRSNTPMRPFGIATGGIAPLSGGEISDIVSFIRTWNEVHTSEGD